MAERELKEAAEFYDSESSGLGAAFLSDEPLQGFEPRRTMGAPGLVGATR
jgi:hypothetical protein